MLAADVRRHDHDRIEQTLARTGRSLSVTPSALEHLVTEGYSLAYGARFLKRVIESRIKLPISQRWAEGKTFLADVVDGKFEVQVSETPYPKLAATA